MSNVAFRYEGVYRVDAFAGGEERFVYAFDGERYTYQARIAQGGGAPELRLDVAFGSDLHLRSVALAALESGGTRRALIEPRADGLGVQRTMPDGTPLLAIVPFDHAQTEVDWRSPCFNGFTCLRLGMRDGEERMLDVRVFDPETFVPNFVEQHYARIGSEEIETSAGRFACTHYQYTVPRFSAPFWVDANGMVVRYEGFCELVALTPHDASR